ncbi:MFS transporter [Billgrantia pellis]|uniref:MFS transporter n=1 Tax=Billgrantia pellis TaxID=2606936 RepID=A0A7V7G2K1_9GAMM|nr:MFS transporter [Halomonas pellis]KAA0011866.1 MFS transporter [Halomonas pellis]
MKLTATVTGRLTVHNPWVGLWVILSAAFMAILDVFIVIVAAPTIRGDLGASTADIQLILAAYNLAFGLTLITGGRLGDLYGRRRIFLKGILLFTLSSLAASLSPNTETLIGMRIVQGLAAGLMMPQVFSIIQVCFDDKGRGKAFGAFAFVSGVAATGAQLAGGVLLALDLFGLGWRTIFLINVPVGVIAWIAARHFVPESKAPAGARPALDLVGVVLLTLTLITVMTPLTLGVEQGWPWWASLGLILSPAMLWAFIRWQHLREARGLTPLVVISLTRNVSFIHGNFMALAFYASNAALFLAIPHVIQDGFGHSPLASGLVFMPLALAFSVTAAWVGKFVSQHAGKLVLGGNSVLILAYCILFLAVYMGEIGSIVWWLSPGALLAGIGMGLVQPSINYLSLRTVSQEEVGSASGLLNTSFEIGYALGTVAAGIVFLSAFTDETLLNERFQAAFGYNLVFTSILALALIAVVLRQPKAKL